jgi:hypothetical protein
MFGMKKWTAELLPDAADETTLHGTSFYQSALRRVTGPQVFTLENDPENRHDRYAVKVLLAGQQVGFLPKEIARPYNTIVIANANRKVWTVVRGEVGDFADGGKWVSVVLPELAAAKALAESLNGQ